MYPSHDVTFITAIKNSFVIYVNWSIVVDGKRERVKACLHCRSNWFHRVRTNRHSGTNWFH